MGLFDSFRKRSQSRPRGPAAASREGGMVWMPSPGGGRGGQELDLPRFRATAGDQPDTRGHDWLSGLRIRLRSAYTPSLPINDRRLFAGRTRVLTELIRSIEDERLHTVVFGERGLGKTSLLHVLAQTARDARYLVIYITCGAASDFDEMARTAAAGISLRFHEDYGPTSPEAERGDTFAERLGEERITVRTAADLLSKVAGTRVLVVLDEFDRARSEEFRRAIAELVKSLADRSVRVQFVIAGVAANLTELVSNVPSIQRNIAAIQVPRMTSDELRELVKKGEDVSGVVFDDAAVQAVVASSLGFPYLASLLSHRAGLNAIDAGRDTVEAADVVAAKSEAVEEARGRITRRSQMQIDQRLQKGMLGALGVLASAAKTASAGFSLEDLDMLGADPLDVSGAKALLERLTREDILIEAAEDEFGRTFHFKEDSVATYLWLLVAEQGALKETSRAVGVVSA